MKFVIRNDRDPDGDTLELQDIFPSALKICDHAETTVDKFIAQKAHLGDSQRWNSLTRKVGKVAAAAERANCLLANASNLAALEVQCNTMLPKYHSFLEGATDTTFRRIVRAQEQFRANMGTITQKNNVVVAEQLQKRMVATCGRVMMVLGSVDSEAYQPSLKQAYAELLQRYSAQIAGSRIMDYPVEAKKPLPNPRSMSMITGCFGISTVSTDQMLTLIEAVADLLKCVDEGRKLQENVANAAQKLNPKQFHSRWAKAEGNPEALERLNKADPQRCDLASELCALDTHKEPLISAYKRVRDALIKLLKFYSGFQNKLDSMWAPALAVIHNNALVAEATAQEALTLAEEIDASYQDLGFLGIGGLDHVFKGPKAPIAG